MKTNRVANWREDKEYIEIIKDLIKHPEVLKMSNIIHHHFTDRLEHSALVSYRSYLIAKKFKLDHVAIARAGLLHDFFLLSREEIAALGLGSHSKVHPMLALESAKKITSISKLEEDIILKHMFGATLCLPKYKESYILTLVDKYVALGEVFVPLSKMFKMRLVLTMYTMIIVLG